MKKKDNQMKTVHRAPPRPYPTQHLVSPMWEAELDPLAVPRPMERDGRFTQSEGGTPSPYTWREQFPGDRGLKTKTALKGKEDRYRGDRGLNTED